MLWELLDIARVLDDRAEISDLLRILALVEIEAKLEILEQIALEYDKRPQFLKSYMENLALHLMETRRNLVSNDIHYILAEGKAEPEPEKQ